MKKFQFSNVLIERIKNKNVLRKRKTNNPYLLNVTKVGDKDDCSKSTDSALSDYKENMSSYMFNNLNPSIASYFNSNITDNMFRAPRRKPINDNADQKIIIADFYLPYICCSDGESINIVIENNSVEPEPIVADFDSNDFNNNDFFTDEQ
jgi:hypothetical protein